MTVAIGVDIGGSAVKFAVVDDKGAIVWPPDKTAERVSYTIETVGIGRLVWRSTGEVEEIPYRTGPADTPPEAKWVVPVELPRTALGRGFQQIKETFKDPIDAVGIGATGLMSRDGVVNEGLAFAGYRGFDWGAAASQAGYGRVRVLNDARAGAWAEYAQASTHEGVHLHITVGTRVGCGIIENWRFLEGADFCAGEFSYLQLISPDGRNYPPGAKLQDGLADDPKAFGAALIGIVHLANPNRIVLNGFDPGFVKSTQRHLERYAFKTLFRRITLEGTTPGSDAENAAREAVAKYRENPGSLLYIARIDRQLYGALSIDGKVRNFSPDFLGQMVVCAPVAIANPGELCFGEIAGSLGIETDYRRRTGRTLEFEEIAGRARSGDVHARDSLETAARVSAVGIVNTCHIVSPSQITLGGAVPVLYPPYGQIVEEYVGARFRGSSYHPVIKRGDSGNDAGVIGAALFALSH